MRDIEHLPLSLHGKQPGDESKFTKPYNSLIAFKSRLSDEWDNEVRRLCKAMQKRAIDPLSGCVSAICVVERGYWFIKDFEKDTRSWCRLDEPDSKEDRLARFVCHASNMAYKAHAERQGRDSSKGLESGIGWLSSPMRYFQVKVGDGAED